MVDVKGKRVFLSGPMSNIKNYNVGMFATVHAELKQMGAESVYDPAVEWLFELGETRTHEEYMRKSINTLTCIETLTTMKQSFDMVIMLPGWEASDGAVLENRVARACGIPDYELHEVIPKTKPPLMSEEEWEAQF